MNQETIYQSHSRPWSFNEGVFLAILAGLAAYFVDDWIGAAAVVVLWAGWHYLQTADGLPVIPFAISFQWFQVTTGLWYYAFTGRRIQTMEISDYRPMVLIGLGCVAALIAGLYWGLSIMRRGRARRGSVDRSIDALPIGWPGLSALYVGALALQGFMQDLAYDYPDLTQPILMFRFVHLAILFIILKRLVRPVLRWYFLVPVLALEVVLGISGFFAGFREPLILAVVAMFDVFDSRRAQHWLAVGGMAIVLVGLSVFWMGVRRDYRAEFSSLDNETFSESRSARLDYLSSVSKGWLQQDTSGLTDNVDALIDRMWVVYYPALAVSRVPSVLPHTDGTLMWSALQHVFSPRVFFPTKAALQSDSELVRKYSGVWVASEEQGTSIAFGYAAESYLDFGLPWMFVPSLIFGLLMGMVYEAFSAGIRHIEIRAGLLAVIFWVALYLFERSWVKTLGVTGTMIVYLGIPALLLDQFLRQRQQNPEHELLNAEP